MGVIKKLEEETSGQTQQIQEDVLMRERISSEAEVCFRHTRSQLRCHTFRVADRTQREI